MTISEVKDTTGNPGPLGLMGFGMTTVLLNLHNAGLFALDSMILAMGIFYGGIAQVIAGIMAWRKGNTFAATAFTSYGSFWLTFVALLLLPGYSDIAVTATPDSVAWASYLLMWALFTGVMLIGTLRLNRALQFIFGSLTILFILLAIAKITGEPLIGQIAGVEGIICGFSAVYTGLAEALNDVYGRVVAPLFPVRKI